MHTGRAGQQCSDQQATEGGHAVTKYFAGDQGEDPIGQALAVDGGITT